MADAPPRAAAADEPLDLEREAAIQLRRTGSRDRAIRALVALGAPEALAAEAVAAADPRTERERADAAMVRAGLVALLVGAAAGVAIAWWRHDAAGIGWDEALPLGLTIAGGAVGLTGTALLVVRSVQVNPLWPLALLLAPVYLKFVFEHWDRSRTPVALGAAGTLLALLALLPLDPVGPPGGTGPAVAADERRVFVVRHCEAGPDGSLTEAGRAHAARIALRLAPHDVAVLWWSPAERAAETAQVIADRLPRRPPHRTAHDGLADPRSALDVLAGALLRERGVVLVTHLPVVEAVAAAYGAEPPPPVPGVAVELRVVGSAVREARVREFRRAP